MHNIEYEVAFFPASSNKQISASSDPATAAETNKTTPEQTF